MNKTFFTCKYCGKEVSFKAIGTKNRNHCPFCLWSLHVDENKPGDRGSSCMGLMSPISLMFKDEGVDKYGKKRQGEIMIVYQCKECGKKSKNRIAGDDNTDKILEICSEKDKKEVERQLFGKSGHRGKK